MRICINLDKAKLRMTGYWNFNTSLLNVKDFRGQLLLLIIIARGLAGSVFGNKWGNTLRTQLGLLPPITADRLVAQKALESRVEGAVKSGDSNRVAIANTELAFLLKKNDHDQVVRTRLNRQRIWLQICMWRNFTVSLVGILHVSRRRMGET